MTTLRTLDETRWGWDWSGAKPRQALVDAVAEILAQRWPVYLNDWDNLPVSNLPFAAYAEDALTWEPGATEESQRRAIRLAQEINAKLGKEQAFYLLLDVAVSSGFHIYRPSGAKPANRYTGVELFITVPVDRAADTDFVRVLTEAARRCWGFRLRVTAVHILTVSDESVYASGYSAGMLLEGWPDGV